MNKIEQIAETKTQSVEESEDMMIVFLDDDTLGEVPRIPVCIICRELYDECIGYDEKTKTCQTCRDLEMTGAEQQVPPPPFYL